jgi:hypothetical protein
VGDGVAVAVEVGMGVGDGAAVGVLTATVKVGLGVRVGGTASVPELEPHAASTTTLTIPSTARHSQPVPRTQGAVARTEPGLTDILVVFIVFVPWISVS